MNEDKQFIVAEISKSWTDQGELEDIISRQFENVIDTNLKRGYTLKEWQAYAIRINEGLTECIIAIFEKIKS